MKRWRVSVLLALLGGLTLSAQSINWQSIVNMPHPQHLAEEHLTAGQRHDVEQAILASNTVWDDCEGDNDWPHKIEVHRINLGEGHFTLAEAGPGCARSGQGANGAMWLLRWDAGKPVMIGDLDGWFDTVLPQAASGLHDIAVGWHDSADEFGLTLYRFNGKRYRLVDGTTVHCDDSSGHCVAAASARKP
ncbi:hypothetical protein [Terriglobus sp.]|uniref:hypothetical protein n=1 Tax=Terriglobus sp. TaxID=1889013 RepID=UPI003B009B76